MENYTEDMLRRQRHADAFMADCETELPEMQSNHVEFRRFKPRFAWVNTVTMQIIFQNFYGGFLGAPAGDDTFFIPPDEQWSMIEISFTGDPFPMTTQDLLKSYSARLDSLSSFVSVQPMLASPVMDIEMITMTCAIEPACSLSREMERAPGKRARHG